MKSTNPNLVSTIKNPQDDYSDNCISLVQLVDPHSNIDVYRVRILKREILVD